MDGPSAINQTFENEHVRAFRKKGGRVVGYSCVFTPVELLDAGGLMPYRIKALGHPETDIADTRLSRFNCRFCRSCLQLGLEGSFDFLDGILETNGCDQLRGMFENWQYARAPAFFHYVKAPHLLSPDAIEHYALELGRLRKALQEHFGVIITDEALRESMARYRRIRRKLVALDGMRERERPGLSGSEALQVVLAAGAVPAAVFDELLDRWSEEWSLRPGHRPQVRLLLGGAATDEPQLVEAIEELGALVVADTLCFGARAYKPLLAEPEKADDVLQTLAETYLRGCRCPRMYDEFDGRLAYVQEALASARADGVILVNNKFCDLHGFDNAHLRMRLESDGVPVLSLEKEYGSPSDHGRMRTRVQAFLESIGGAR